MRSEDNSEHCTWKEFIGINGYVPNLMGSLETPTFAFGIVDFLVMHMSESLPFPTSYTWESI